jgi:antirestriction protein
MIEPFVTNLGKYNEGELCGEYLKLPATKEDMQALLARIGVDGVVYEETFISDYETDLAGMNRLGEYESIDELNYLATLLEELPDYELEKFEAAAVYGEYSGSAKDLINLAQNLDCYDYFPGIGNNEELGYCLAHEYEMLEIPENVRPYFDYEAYGRDYSISEGGEFTDSGYITRGYGGFTEHYGGRDDLPDECRIFHYPDPPDKMPMKQQLEMYGKMALAQATADRPTPVREDRV